jgi:predicted nucleotidyltransferase
MPPAAPGAPSLPEKLLGLHEAFTTSDIPYGFGGAIALAYHAEPRSTDDIDVNVLLRPEAARRVIDALATVFDIANRDDVVRTITEHGQVRLLWGSTPVDLFFMDTAFHESLARRVREVAFGDAAITVISAEDLVVCKALFNRPHDWVDIARIARIGGASLDRSYVEDWTAYFVGPDDDLLERVRLTLAGA